MHSFPEIRAPSVSTAEENHWIQPYWLGRIQPIYFEIANSYKFALYIFDDYVEI